MRLPFWSRLVAGWLACWLPLVLAEGGWLHACPMHDGAAPAAMTAMAAAPGAHADHGGHGAHSRHQSAAHCCTCLGACCAAAAVLPAPPPPVAFATFTRAPIRATGRPAHEYVAAWVAFVLPYSTAPPQAAAA